MNVEQRQRQHQPVRGGPSPGLNDAARLGEEVVVIEQRTFGPARRTRRIQEERRAFRS